MGLRTPLYDWHVAHGARIVDFAGWDMPVIYTSIVEEHQAVRTAAGMFDISHMGRLWVQGPDALDLVQLLYTNNAATMKDGQVRYGLVCNPQGGIRDDVLVYRWADGFGMVVNASNRKKIVDWIQEHGGRRNVQVSDTTQSGCMVAVQGPNAVELCRGIVPAAIDQLPYYFACRTTFRGKNCAVSRTGYTGEDGFEFIISADQGVTLWEELLSRGAKPCALGARDTLRLEAAMPLYGHELSEEIDPFQAGLSWAVKLEKGEFLGREALLKRKADTSLRQRIGLELAGKRIPREGFAVLADAPVGQVTSGTFAPTLQKCLAMAYVEPASSAPGTKLAIDIRGKPEPATVVKLPFYKRK
jgi:aminomethyltransferase